MEEESQPPVERQAQRRLSELNGLLGRSDEGSGIAGEAIKSAVSVVLGDAQVSPLVAEGVRRFIEALVGHRQGNLEKAVRVLVEAYGTAYDDILQRLQADPQLEDFTLRVFASATEVANQDKLEYYANLLKGTAAADPPDEVEREKLLDTLNELRRRHLRLVHAIAVTEGVPAEVENMGSVWATIRHVSGIDQSEAEEDVLDLVRLRLLSNGWKSVANLRLGLTEYGLRFEEYVAGRGGRSRPRWEAELVTGQSGLLEELAQEFGGHRDPRMVRELGGLALTSTSWDPIDDPTEIRRRAEKFVKRILIARTSLVTPQNPPPVIAVERIWERREGYATVHEPATFLEVSGPPEVPEFPSSRYLDTAERLMAEDSVVERAVRLGIEPSWEVLVECLNLVERDLGYPVHELPQVAPQEVERFDAEAVAHGLDRPAPGAPAQMSIDQAAAFIRQVLKSWILVKAGRWPSPRGTG